MFSLSLNLHMAFIVQSEGYRRHSQASVAAAQPGIAKGLHHGPAFQQLQPRGSPGALGSAGIAFLALLLGAEWAVSLRARNVTAAQIPNSW